jgi:hypothetical protein
VLLKEGENEKNLNFKISSFLYKFYIKNMHEKLLISFGKNDFENLHSVNDLDWE